MHAPGNENRTGRISNVAISPVCPDSRERSRILLAGGRLRTRNGAMDKANFGAFYLRTLVQLITSAIVLRSMHTHIHIHVYTVLKS